MTVMTADPARTTKLDDVQRRLGLLMTLRLDGPLFQAEQAELRDLYRRERQLLGLSPG